MMVSHFYSHSLTLSHTHSLRKWTKKNDGLTLLLSFSHSLAHTLPLSQEEEWMDGCFSHFYSHSLTLSLTHTHFYSLILSLSLTHTPTLRKIFTHTYTYSHILTHTHTYSHIPTHTYTYLHILTHTYTYSLSLSHTLTPTLPLSGRGRKRSKSSCRSRD